MMFNKLKEHRVADKEEAESVKNAEVIALEQRFLNEISELQEKSKIDRSDLEDNLKKAEKDNKK